MPTIQAAMDTHSMTEDHDSPGYTARLATDDSQGGRPRPHRLRIVLRPGILGPRIALAPVRYGSKAIDRSPGLPFPSQAPQYLGRYAHSRPTHVTNPTAWPTKGSQPPQKEYKGRNSPLTHHDARARRPLHQKSAAGDEWPLSNLAASTTARVRHTGAGMARPPCDGGGLVAVKSFPSSR